MPITSPPNYPYDIGYDAAWFCRHIAHDAACLDELRANDPEYVLPTIEFSTATTALP